MFTGQNIPKPSVTFQDMNICSSLKQIILNNIEHSLWKEPTPIQMQSKPVVIIKIELIYNCILM